MGHQPYQDLGINEAGEEGLVGKQLQGAPFPTPYSSPHFTLLCTLEQVGCIAWGQGTRGQIGVCLSSQGFLGPASLMAGTKCSQREGWGPSVQGSVG